MFQNNQEVYALKVAESKLKIWYVSSDGSVTSVFKSINKKIIIHPFNKDGHATIKINGKETRLSRLIARNFIRGFNSQLRVGYKDGNKFNCNVNNLYLYTQTQHGKRTGYKSRSKAVIVKEYRQEPIEYRSIRTAAKHLYCSYQTLLDYLSGTVKTSVLKKFGRKIYYKNKI
jgi:hypothetical protein